MEGGGGLDASLPALGDRAPNRAHHRPTLAFHRAILIDRLAIVGVRARKVDVRRVNVVSRRPNVVVRRAIVVDWRANVVIRAPIIVNRRVFHDDRRKIRVARGRKSVGFAWFFAIRPKNLAVRPDSGSSPATEWPILEPWAAVADGRWLVGPRERAMRLPSSKIGKLEYLEGRVDRWDADPDAVGLAPGQSAAAVESTEAARAAYDAMLAARRHAEAMHDAWLGAVKKAENDGRSCLRSIVTFAKNSPQPGAIYARASVEPPRDKAPLGKPATPAKLKISLDTQGRAKLTWGGTRHGGTVFTVQRRVASVDGQAGPWETIATVPQRKWTDEATPSGVLNISYRVRGERVGGASPFSSPIALPLGSAGPPASVAGAIAPRAASGKDAG
jgi:hypothetical protein